jgi:hypothetical protein
VVVGLSSLLATTAVTSAQTFGTASVPAIVTDIAKQPLMVEVDHLLQSLAFVGRPISEADRNAIYEAAKQPDDKAVVAIQQVLDRYALVRVDIDPLRKVTVQPVSGSSETLMKNGWTTFLVKVSNRAGTTEELDVDSPQAAMPYDFSRMQVERSVYDDQFTDVMLEHLGYLGRWISVQAAAAAGANRGLAGAWRPLVRSLQGSVGCRQPVPWRFDAEDPDGPEA